VGVASQDCDLATVLPVPDANGLVVTGGNNPRQFVVELDSAYVVDVSVKREHALLGFIAPNLDQVVITSRHEHRLGVVEVDATYRT